MIIPHVDTIADDVSAIFRGFSLDYDTPKTKKNAHPTIAYRIYEVCIKPSILPHYGL
jgi:hypothetical protein